MKKLLLFVFAALCFSSLGKATKPWTGEYELDRGIKIKRSLTGVELTQDEGPNVSGSQGIVWKKVPLLMSMEEPQFRNAVSKLGPIISELVLFNDKPKVSQILTKKVNETVQKRSSFGPFHKTKKTVRTSKTSSVSNKVILPNGIFIPLSKNKAALKPTAKAAPKLPPKAAPKLSPKAAPKLPPKAAPKLSPKAAPKLSPKAALKPKAVPTRHGISKPVRTVRSTPTRHGISKPVRSRAAPTRRGISKPMRTIRPTPTRGISKPMRAIRSTPTRGVSQSRRPALTHPRIRRR